MKTLFSLLIISAGLLNSMATLSFYDPFSYSVADNTTVIGQSPSLPGGTTWNRGGTTGSDPLVRTSLGLSVPGLATSSGGALQYGGVGNTVHARVGLGTTYSTAETTVYYSLALRVLDLGGLGAAGGFLFGFNNLTASSASTFSTYGTRVFVLTNGFGGDGTVFRIGMSKNNTAGIEATDAVDRSPGDTIFIVGSWTFHAGGTGTSGSGNDGPSLLWINPSSVTFGAGSAPTADLTSLTTPGDLATIVSFAIRQTSLTTPSVLIDELRIGDTWADVTPVVPEPGTAALAITAGLAILALRRFRSRN